ncbi:hypothetical protein [Streptomyces sp. NPDC058412]|uniref:hypothetical protein n=1 Tax=Streptomyces sp. NPDC058412 TaxID=3346486 RepID=UPI00366892E6
MRGAGTAGDAELPEHVDSHADALVGLCGRWLRVRIGVSSGRLPGQDRGRFGRVLVGVCRGGVARGIGGRGGGDTGEERGEGTAGVLCRLGAGDPDGQGRSGGGRLAVVLGELPRTGRGGRLLGRDLEGVDVLPVLLVRDALKGDRGLQRGQESLVAAGGAEDLGVGERVACAVAGGKDHGRLQIAGGGQGVGELDDVVIGVVPGPDEEPRQDLFPALVCLEEEFPEVGGYGRQVRNRTDPALRQRAGEAGAQSGGEDFAVVGPCEGAQFQGEGAGDFKDFVTGGRPSSDHPLRG